MSKRKKTVKLSEFRINPNNPFPASSDEEFQRLVSNVKEHPGFLSYRPIVYDPDDDNKILGGNKRFAALLELGYEEAPADWFADASDLSPEERQEFILADNINYGAWDYDALRFWDEETLEKWSVPPESMDLPSGDPSADDDDIYTREIKAPVYEPSPEKPHISDLVDQEKYLSLVKEIRASGLPKKEQDFLALAAARHLVFDYALIADYYAHSDAKVQELMERSALVIIDMKKAIQQGFVRMTDDLRNEYLNEVEEEE